MFAMLLLVLLPWLPGSPPPPLPLSDQVGVYGLIDKVVFRPDADNPKRVELWGAFAVAEGPNGDYYKAPRWGYLLFAAKEGKEEDCVTQWRDLESLAGSGTCAGFSFRYRQQDVRVWTTADANPQAAIYEPAMGVHKVERAGYGPIGMLRHLPRPLAPAGAAAVAPVDEHRPAAPIVLECEPCAADDAGCRYLFELRRADGETLASPPVAAEGGKVRWKVTTALWPGEQMEWSVRVLREGLEVAPVARAGFGVASAPRKQR